MNIHPYSWDALATILRQHIDSHQTAGHDWPADAEFCVVYNTSTWPCGWGKESRVEFFPSKAKLETWFAEMREWSRLEDNYFAAQAYAWDFGPVLIEELTRNEWDLAPTYQQRVQRGDFK